MRLLILVVLSVAVCLEGKGLCSLRRVCAASLCGLLFTSNVHAEVSLTQQLQEIRLQDINKQKDVVRKAEEDLMSREILYKPGKLVARGVTSLTTDGLDPREFPLGLSSAAMIDADFGKDSAALFLLAVGRDGPPLAARKVLIKDLTFPLVWEMTDEDLIFPYTPEAWDSSPFSKDTIAVTAILNSEGRLSLPIAAQRIGYATSDPTIIAGTTQRTSANMLVSNKIDSSLYTVEELTLLKSIDEELDQRSGAPQQLKKDIPSPQQSKSTSVNKGIKK
jgi:hypothetical protein